MRAEWRIDQDFAEELASLVWLDYADIPADRRRLAEIVQAVPVSEAGVSWHDEVLEPDADLPPVRLRIYQPAAGGNGAGVMHIHSGGWVVGDLDFEHADNVRLVRLLGVSLVSVEYRLAPEHPYPAGLDDCCRAWRWLAASAGQLGIDPGRIALTGASAGAALAVGVALRCRDSTLNSRALNSPALAMPGAVCLQDPALDDRLTNASSAFEGTPVIDRTRLVRIWDAYLGAGLRGTDAVHAYAAPARVDDLRGLPPTYVSAAEFDPVRDDALAFAVALTAAGVATELHLYPGTYHGSFKYLGASVSQRAEAQRLAYLTRVLAL
jgi:acetyl esterase